MESGGVSDLQEAHRGLERGIRGGTQGPGTIPRKIVTLTVELEAAGFAQF